jgi:CheY-like chemotaxis protein
MISKKESYANARIVAADDQLINIEVLKSNIEELGLASTCDFCINGQDTIDTVKRIVDEGLASRDALVTSISPVDFLLLDFQMPRKNGIEVVKEIKEFYKIKQSQLPSKFVLRLPTIVFLTAYATTAFRKHVESLGVTQVYEKPIQIEQLVEVLSSRADQEQI